MSKGKTAGYQPNRLRTIAAWLGNCTVVRAKIFAETNAERYRQLGKWGEQRHPDLYESRPEGYADAVTLFESLAANYKRLNDESADADDGSLDWTGILLEEVYEALIEAATGDTAKLREELVQSMAVIAAWIEDVDTRE